MNINPYFEANGKRYEIKKTRWLIAEHRKFAEVSGITKEEKAATVKAQSLIEDAQKYANMAKEKWDALCENPTEENEREYSIFKRMADEAISKSYDFIANNNSIEEMAQKNIDILEKIAVKGIAEQYCSLDEEKAQKIWDKFVEECDDRNYVNEWLFAMSNALFVEEDKEEKDDFLSQVRRETEKKKKSYKNSLAKR